MFNWSLVSAKKAGVISSFSSFAMPDIHFVRSDIVSVVILPLNLAFVAIASQKSG
jgi:hypothetical protein